MIVTYLQFLQQLKEQYVTLFEKGLKKQANKALDLFLESFDQLDELTKGEIYYQLCEGLCDTPEEDIVALQKRSNGQLPFALHNRVHDYLFQECKQNKMPHLCWYYQLFRHDKMGSQHAFAMLQKAYEHKDCDPKTIVLLLENYIDYLAWGCHHFPDGCIIERSGAEETIRLGKELLSQHPFALELQQEFLYYEQLYRLYWQYQEEEGQNFGALCHANGIPFAPVKAYYYKK